MSQLRLQLDDDTDLLAQVDSAALWAELSRRSAEKRAAEDAQRAERAAYRASVLASRAKARAALERARKDARWEQLRTECEARDRADKRSARVAELIAGRHEARALWNLPSFDEVACGNPEFDGRSRQDDIDSETSIEFSAVDYVDDTPLYWIAAQCVNRSYLQGEVIDGKWQPLSTTEYRRDGSRFQRYFTDKVNHVGDLHQLDGGETVIVAVLVGTRRYHVMRCEKLWLDTHNREDAKRWGRMNPGRTLSPAKRFMFVYDPKSYVEIAGDPNIDVDRHDLADDAADLAWRWSTETRIDRYELEAHGAPTTVGPDFLRSSKLRREMSEQSLWAEFNLDDMTRQPWTTKPPAHARM